jgi:hypothetical protein
VKEVLQTSEPGRVHRYLAHFRKRLDEIGLISRYQMIVTAKYDAELERALQLEREPFDVAVYMGPGTDYPGKFMHLPWDKEPVVVNEPNNYTGFPFTENGQLSRTLVVRINGVVEDHDAGYGGKGWKDNFVIAEDHYIDYLSGRTAEDLIPAQILAKLREASKLFLGYSMRDWRLRVFLKRIWQGQNLVRSRAWAVERDPDELERQLWLQSSVEVVTSSLIDYVDGFDAFLLANRDKLAQ